MKIRKFQRGDEEAISKLHNETVREINGKDYSKEQIESWSPILTKFDKMIEMLENNITYVALLDTQIVGFGELSEKGEMKRLYTHKNHQGKGVGSALLEILEEEAKKMGMKEINLESSITAKTFYEAKGYRCIGEKTMDFQGVKHQDWAMVKKL